MASFWFRDFFFYMFDFAGFLSTSGWGRRPASTSRQRTKGNSTLWWQFALDCFFLLLVDPFLEENAVFIPGSVLQSFSGHDPLCFSWEDKNTPEGFSQHLLFRTIFAPSCSGTRSVSPEVRSSVPPPVSLLSYLCFLFLFFLVFLESRGFPVR